MRKDAIDAIEARPEMTEWVIDETQTHRLDSSNFVIGGPQRQAEVKREILPGHAQPEGQQLALYLSLKRLRGTYSNMPEDGWAVAAAMGVDVFVVEPTKIGGGCFVLWFSPISYMSEMCLFLVYGSLFRNAI